jgi:hypothetical protein
MNPTVQQSSLIELDSRTADHMEIRLLWNPAEDDVIVTVDDSKTGESLQISVPPEKALDAFRHPFVYAT